MDSFYDAGNILEIPARGYQMSQAWFFMDQEVFESILVRGFLMEDLPLDLFEKFTLHHGEKFTKL